MKIQRKVPEMVYHCLSCKDIILVEVIGDGVIPEGILCQATPKCQGRMVRYARDRQMSLPSSVYVYQWVNSRLTKDVSILSLIPKPNHPRISRVHLVVRNAIQQMAALPATL